MDIQNEASEIVISSDAQAALAAIQAGLDPRLVMKALKPKYFPPRASSKQVARAETLRLDLERRVLNLRLERMSK